MCIGGVNRLVTGEEIDGLGNLFVAFVFGEAFALIDMGEDVQLARSLECAARCLDLGNEFATVTEGVAFEVFAESANLAFGPVEAIAQLLFGSFVHRYLKCTIPHRVLVKYTPLGYITHI